jgi:hypothetical protein
MTKDKGTVIVTRVYKSSDTFGGYVSPHRPTANKDTLLERALGILHRMAVERTGWKSIARRWYYSDEPLRNDAANLIREAGYQQARPSGTRLVGDRAQEIEQK